LEGPTSGHESQVAGTSPQNDCPEGTPTVQQSVAANAIEPPDISLLSPLLIHSKVPTSPFASERASQPLRICCYGSSSSQTPAAYLQPAAEVGYLLGRRGHTCVNGAGSYGCMAAMNEGANCAQGHIVGVIHKFMLVDGAGPATNKGTKGLLELGANSVFDSPHTKISVCDEMNDKAPIRQSADPALENDPSQPIRQLLVAGGIDLQERKRLLVQGANALIVLPGGPGTFDEMWEMACARNLGMSQLPMVCVNIDNYYEPFRQMLERAWKDKLVKLRPQDIIHFASSAEEAVRWCEDAQHREAPFVELKKRKEALRSQSVLGSPIVETSPKRRISLLLGKSISWLSSFGHQEQTDEMQAREMLFSGWVATWFTLATGVGLGLLIAESRDNVYSSMQY